MYKYMYYDGFSELFCNTKNIYQTSVEIVGNIFHFLVGKSNMERRCHIITILNSIDIPIFEIFYSCLFL